MLVPAVQASTDEGGTGEQSFDALIASADAHADAGRLRAALDKYEEAAHKEPANYLGHWKCAITRVALGNTAHVLEELGRVLELNPKFGEASSLHRARQYAKSGEFTHAKADIESIEKEQQEGDGAGQLGDISELEALGKAVEAKDHGECIKQATKLQQIASNMASVRRTRARCYLALGDGEHAVNDLSRAVALEPEDAETQLLTARLKYFALDSQMVAIAHVKQCLHFDPEHKECKALFRKLKKLDKEIKKATEEAGSKKWSAAMRKVAGPVGKPEAGLGHQVEEEMNRLEEEFGVKDKMPRKLYARLASIACQGYAELKLADKALRWCSDAIKHDPDNVDAYIARGDMYLQKEQPDEAMDDFNAVKDKTDGGDHRIRERISRTSRLQAKASRRDYYKILGVPRDASKREIKKAYRKLAQEWHPDTYRGDLPAEKVEAKMSELNIAYAVLSDDDKRAQFDQGVDPEDPHGHAGGGGGGGGQQYHFQQGHGFGGGNPFEFFFGSNQGNFRWDL
ncbi:hypothetical protein SYNPS1DRAFT_13691 [Syncephalis pseudoplumigaleata]|uniref:J domain-containing protein n=1 Tax=Syncephalis pseudoplumigaleata TaxID=1712513 RepID=A0A4P9Z316_9FUNG|nr:hypothetical protein SYNPS1DRAFT_13691 [Syncephalis pseudoplumigaleata]|eukprot:RKP26785.1 hypothetical protein SYNPS1DRAFT_13691 [Syncephalis pseudoplumigaleata]